jgi:cobalamin biosynthesis Mg chelatase CobN
MTAKKLPKWFTDNPHTITYQDGSNVTNPFSGESYELNNEEVSMYDYIIGLQILIDRKGGALHPDSFKYQKDLRRGLDWFRSANPEAYMVLLD